MAFDLEKVEAQIGEIISKRIVLLLFSLDTYFGEISLHYSRRGVNKTTEVFLFHTASECTFKISVHKKLKASKIL